MNYQCELLQNDIHLPCTLEICLCVGVKTSSKKWKKNEKENIPPIGQIPHFIGKNTRLYLKSDQSERLVKSFKFSRGFSVDLCCSFETVRPFLDFYQNHLTVVCGLDDLKFLISFSRDHVLQQDILIKNYKT